MLIAVLNLIKFIGLKPEVGAGVSFPPLFPPLGAPPIVAMTTSKALAASLIMAP